jgi:hypothetical protein
VEGGGGGGGAATRYPEVFPSPKLSPEDENDAVSRPHVAAAVFKLRAAHAMRQATRQSGGGGDLGFGGGGGEWGAPYVDLEPPVDLKEEVAEVAAVPMDAKQAGKVAAKMAAMEKKDVVEITKHQGTPS